MPQFAGTKQKVLEVLVQRVTKMHYSISARGVVYPFDADVAVRLYFVCRNSLGRRSMKLSFFTSLLAALAVAGLATIPANARIKDKPIISLLRSGNSFGPQRIAT
jgi:hypothetical protein